MKRAEFQKSESNMAELDALLRHPIMHLAIEIAKAESIGLPDPISGVDYQAQVSVCGAFTAGAFRMIERLESLARPVTLPASSMPRQNQYEDAAKAKMREQGVYNDKEIEELR